MIKTILFISILACFACKKTETINDAHLDIIDDEIEIVYDTSHTNSYYIIDYKALGMLRVFWHSTDSFTTIIFNDTIKTPVINYSTYTRENGTGSQIVYFNKSNIGDTLNVYASSNSLIDSVRVIIK